MKALNNKCSLFVGVDLDVLCLIAARQKTETQYVWGHRPVCSCSKNGFVSFVAGPCGLLRAFARSPAAPSRAAEANDIWLVGSVVFFQVCLVTNFTVLLEPLGGETSSCAANSRFMELERACGPGWGEFVLRSFGQAGLQDLSSADISSTLLGPQGDHMV